VRRDRKRCTILDLALFIAKLFDVDKWQAIRASGRIGGFCVRHLLALLVTVALPCVLWTVVYFALLLWAVLTGGGVGGPLAYPVGLLFLFASATISSLVLLFPSTALAAWFSRRCALPVLAQIPISVTVLAVLCFTAVAVAGAAGRQPFCRDLSVSFGILFAVHLLPLGLYWWIAQSVPLLLSLVPRSCTMPPNESTSSPHAVLRN
jgi:hypothetical protein